MFDKLSFLFTTSDQFDIIWGFSYDNAGLFHIDATVNQEMVSSNTTVQLLLCPDSSMDLIRTMDRDQV